MHTLQSSGATWFKPGYDLVRSGSDVGEGGLTSHLRKGITTQIDYGYAAVHNTLTVAPILVMFTAMCSQ